MKAEIISVGTELLLGDIVNTNAQYLSRRLADLGFEVFHQSVVGDNEARLKEELAFAFSRSDMVITTGGLGPTKDDLTKEIAAEYFNKALILDEESLKKLKAFFASRGVNCSENNLKQAYFPEASIIVPNAKGTAPGCILEDNGKIIILLPGPPREMVPMFETEILPFLESKSSDTIVSKVLRISGIGESLMEERVRDIIDVGLNPTVAPYAKDSEAILRITAKAKSKKEAEILIKPIEDEIRNRFKENVYGTGDNFIENVIGELLIRNNLTISTAESCTGGLLAGKLINYSGISAAFLVGAITYSNEAKMKRLGVKKETLDRYGAVSEETAMEMAEGIAKSSGTDIGISTTGIAGPEGGTKDKPVGLVYLGLYIKGEVMAKELNLTGDRQKIRDKAVFDALDWLRRELMKQLGIGN